MYYCMNDFMLGLTILNHRPMMDVALVLWFNIIFLIRNIDMYMKNNNNFINIKFWMHNFKLTSWVLNFLKIEVINLKFNIVSPINQATPNLCMFKSKEKCSGIDMSTFWCKRKVVEVWVFYSVQLLEVRKLIQTS